jgi:hypothetical protein
MEPVTIAFVALAVGGGITAARRFRRRARHASVALVGPRRAGKTSFAKALETGEIPPGYRPTQTTVTKEINILKDSDPHDFVIKTSRYGLHVTAHDVSGNENAWGEWKKVALNFNLVCFLVSAPELAEAPYRDNALDGARQVGSWNLVARLLLVLTHIDRDPDRANPDAIRQRPAARALSRALGHPEMWLTSLTRADERHDLMLKTLEILAERRTAHA